MTGQPAFPRSVSVHAACEIGVEPNIAYRMRKD